MKRIFAKHHTFVLDEDGEEYNSTKIVEVESVEDIDRELRHELDVEYFVADAIPVPETEARRILAGG